MLTAIHPFISFQSGFLLLFNKYFIEAEFGILLGILAIGAMFDVRYHRIPNWLVLSGAIAGFLYHTLSAYGAGGISAFEGLLVGLFSFLPLYCFRAMGAGDVKLMACVGSFLGPASALGAVLTTLIAGGILAVLVVIQKRAITTVVENARIMVANMNIGIGSASTISVDQTPRSVGTLPYAVAIGAGTTAHIFLLHAGHALVH